MFVGTLVTGMFLSTAPTVTADGENWWNASWGSRTLITIDNSFVGDTLYDFPIFLRIWENDTLSSSIQDDGDDIVFIDFTDNSTQFAHEIEYFNDDATYVNTSLWVNVSEVSSSAPTKIWMYYDNAGCSAQQNRTGTWNASKYYSVYHFYDHNDSTKHYRNLTLANGTEAYELGDMGMSAVFDGLTYYNVTNYCNYFSLNCVYNSSTDSTDSQYIMMKTNGIAYDWYINPTYNTRTEFRFNCKNSGENWIDTSYVHPTDTYEYLTLVTRDGSTAQLWQSPDTITGDTVQFTVMPNHNANLGIGGRDYSTSSFLIGNIEEIQFMNTTVITSSESQTTRDFFNQSTGLITLGAQETRDTSTTVENSVPVPSNGATGQERNPTLNITINCNNKKWMNQTFWTNASGSWHRYISITIP